MRFSLVFTDFFVRVRRALSLFPLSPIASYLLFAFFFRSGRSLDTARWRKLLPIVSFSRAALLIFNVLPAQEFAICFSSRPGQEGAEFVPFSQEPFFLPLIYLVEEII